MTDEETTRIPPVNPQDTLKEQQVFSEGKKGEGVVKYENYIIFVEGAKIGETVDIKIEKVFKNFALAKVITEDSEDEEFGEEEEKVEEKTEEGDEK